MTVSRIGIILIGCVALSLNAQTTAPIVSHAIPSQTLSPGGAAAAVNLANYFTIPGFAGQVVQFDTVLGKFAVQLRPDVAPRAVANFLGYVQRGDYSNSLVHRSASLDGGPISIVQGGGYYVTGSTVATIPTQSPVPLEYNLPNARGTLAAARLGGDPNSATDQWYINVRDDSTILSPGQANTDGYGYTVFGQVIGSGMSVVDAIAALPRVNAGSPFDEMPVRNYSGGTIQGSNMMIVNSITPISLFPDSSTSGVIGFSIDNSAPGVVSASLSGSVLVLTPGSAAGTATITVHATDLSGDSVSTTFAVAVTSSSPSITSQPSSYTVATGNTVVFNASASAASSYQWQHNGIDVSGGTNSMLVISNTSAADAGTYTLIARNANGSATSNAATLTVSNVAPSDVGRLANLSVRTNPGTGSETLIVGFAVGGAGASGSQPLLLRGMGPSLTQLNVSNVLADPVVTLYQGSTVIASNDNWGGDATVSSRVSQTGAFGFLAPNSLDAALASSPGVGAYTMQLTANGAMNGNALAEIYDATTNITATSPRLMNLSARAKVGTGGDILIAGFVIHGSTARTVLIRAIGPELGIFGLSGLLANPSLQLVPGGSATAMAQNDDWGGDAQIASVSTTVGAFPLSNGGSTASALLVTLPPGDYTAQVSGADGGTGVALVEVYEVP